MIYEIPRQAVLDFGAHAIIRADLNQEQLEYMGTQIG